jgi:hypothetical protein
MDFNRNLNGVMVNPCEKRPAATAAKESGNSHVANDLSANAVVADFTMGVQSQLREGAIKKCEKIGTKVKARRVCKQNAFGGGVAFVEKLHCRMCAAKNLHTISKNKKNAPTVAIPHWGHHKKCSHNTKTRGLSAMTVFVNREAARNVAINAAPMGSILGQRFWVRDSQQKQWKLVRMLRASFLHTRMQINQIKILRYLHLLLAMQWLGARTETTKAKIRKIREACGKFSTMLWIPRRTKTKN